MAKPPPKTIIGFKIDAITRQQLEFICRLRATRVSSFLRDATRKALARELAELATQSSDDPEVVH